MQDVTSALNQSCLSLPADRILTGATTSDVVLLQHCSIVARMSLALTSSTHYASPRLQINMDWQLFAHVQHMRGSYCVWP